MAPRTPRKIPVPLRLIVGCLLAWLPASPLLAQNVLGERMSHSHDATTEPDMISYLCGDPGGGESWIRVYDPADFGVQGSYAITAIRFAVNFADAGVTSTGDSITEQPIEVTIYEDTDPGDELLAADLDELYFEEIVIADSDDPRIITHELDEFLEVEADQVLVIAIHRPESDPAESEGRVFAFGSNSEGENGQSYYWGVTGACEDDDPISLDGAIIAGEETDVHHIIDVEFRSGCVIPTGFNSVRSDDVNVLVWTSNGEYDSIDVYREGEFLESIDGDSSVYIDFDGGLEDEYQLVVEFSDPDCSATTPVRTVNAYEVSADPGIDIAGEAVEDTIEIEDVDTIVRVAVRVDIDHPRANDLLIELESPSGTTARLRSEDTGDAMYADVKCTFDPDGYEFRGPLTMFEIPVQPIEEGALSQLRNETLEGEWTLTVRDLLEDEDSGGVLNGWTLYMDLTASPTFLRGDVDGNGDVSGLTDALALLLWAFSGGDDPVCDDAADVNGDNSLSALTDAVSLLQYSFSGGDAPPAPGPSECGQDDDLDEDLDCAEQPLCP